MWCGACPAPGTALRRPALAATLETIATGGREAFYLGDVGTGIIEATDGTVILEDLERRQAEWVVPIAANLFDLTAWTVPPNSQGWLTLATLRVFEMLDVPAADEGVTRDDPSGFKSILDGAP